MAEGYLLKEVHVTLNPGVVVIAQVDTIEAISKLLKDLQDRKLFAPAPPQKKELIQDHDTPERRLEAGASLTQGSLAKGTIIAFKDNVPELLGTTTLNVTDAVLILLLGLEMGLRRPKIEYDAFKALYESQNIKSGSPLSMKLTDLKNSSYIDKKVYTDEKCLRLTAKGQKKAIEALQSRLRS